jgi:integrase
VPDMVSIRLPYVTERGAAFRYRRRVPPGLVERLGVKQWIHTWPSRTPLAVVEAEARQMAAAHDRLITETKRAKVEGIAQELIKDRAAEWYLDFAQEANFRDAETLAVVRAIKAGGQLGPAVPISKLQGDKALAYAQQSFVKVIGNLEAFEVKRADVRRWIEAQQRQGLAPGTITRRLGALRAATGRLYLDHDIERPNPFASHRIASGGGSERDRVPFNRAMLALIARYIQSGAVGFETRAIIQIMQCTGLGPAEAGGLLAGDVFLDHEVPHLYVRANALRPLKARSRDRRVPLLGVALDAAGEAVSLADGAPTLAGEASGALFSFNRSGRGADTISAKINKAIRRSGVPQSPRLVAYSFRHGVAEALRQVGAPYHVTRQLLGHSTREIADRYGSPQARLIEARQWLSQALDVLGDVDDSIYSESEKPGL